MDLYERIAAIRDKLTAHSPGTEAYAHLQSQLGDACTDLARQHQSVEAYRQAINAYEAALDIYTTTSIDFLMVHNSLGNVFWQLSQLEDNEAYIQRAIAAYQHALRYCDSDQVPIAYATLHNNLGNVYASLEDEESLNQAIASYQETLLHVDPKSPAFATLQNNLGNVCRRLAKFEDREVNLQRALTAYKQALRIFTPLMAPLPYATLRANMGIVYEQMGDLHEAAMSWKDAAAVASLAGATEEAEYFSDLAQKTLAQLDDDGE